MPFRSLLDLGLLNFQLRAYRGHAAAELQRLDAERGDDEARDDGRGEYRPEPRQADGDVYELDDIAEEGGWCPAHETH